MSLKITDSQESLIVNALNLAARSYQDSALQVRNVETCTDLPALQRGRLAEQFDRQSQDASALADAIQRNGLTDEGPTGLVTDQAAAAIGPRNGDHLELSNRWARITLMRNSERSFSVSGDAQRERDLSLGTAVVLALNTLAKYAAGRAD